MQAMRRSRLLLIIAILPFSSAERRARCTCRHDRAAAAGWYDHELDTQRSFRPRGQPIVHRRPVGPQRQRRHGPFFAISPQGNLLGTFPLSGATAQDWEDIAIGPRSDGGNYLYLGDIGDNKSVRPYMTVYRTNEPTSSAGSTIPIGRILGSQIAVSERPAQRGIAIRRSALRRHLYPQQVEVDANLQCPRKHIQEPRSNHSDDIDGKLGPISTATAADISPDGRFILIRSSSSTTGYLYERESGQTIADALHGTGIPFPLGFELQGEAIGWAADGKGFYTTSEIPVLTSAPIMRMRSPLRRLCYPETTMTIMWSMRLITRFAQSAWSGSCNAQRSGDTRPLADEDYAVWKVHFGESLDGGGAGKYS